MKLSYICTLLSLAGAFLALHALGTKKNQATLKIMTYNIRRKGKEKKPARLWQHRLPRITDILTAEQPDIIGFQEPLKAQIDDLKKILPGYNVFGKPRGTSLFGFATNEFNPIFYHTKKFKLLEHGTFLINRARSFSERMPWNIKKKGLLPRICTWGRFQVKKTGQQFYVYNTHFDHMFEQAQITCAQTIADDIKKRTHGEPVIVMGDFNTSFTGALQDVFGGFVHMKDKALVAHGPKETMTGWDNKKPMWIDHMLCNRPTHITILHYSVIQSADNVYPSDHRPVSADIVLTA